MPGVKGFLHERLQLQTKAEELSKLSGEKVSKKKAAKVTAAF